MSEPKGLGTVAVAKRLGLPNPETSGRRHVERLIKRGHLKGHNHGSGERAYWIVAREDLDAYLEQARKPPHSRDCSNTDRTDTMDRIVH